MFLSPLFAATKHKNGSRDFFSGNVIMNTIIKKLKMKQIEERSERRPNVYLWKGN